jgi:hypothetical protein
VSATNEDRQKKIEAKLEEISKQIEDLKSYIVKEKKDLLEEIIQLLEDWKKKGEGKQLIFSDKKGIRIPVTGEFAKAMGYPSKKEERYMTKAEIAALPYEYRVSGVKNGQQFSFTCYTAEEAYDLARELKSLGAKDINVSKVPKSQG